jgi:spermidine synthase
VTDGQWISDQLHDFYRIAVAYQDVLVDEHTDYQHIQIVQTRVFGKVLLLDGIIQLTELDNCGYHEMLVHVPMLAHNDPQNVLIVGGGDGGALQQVLKYPSVERVTVCELDRRVVEVCSQHFPAFDNPFDDYRVELMIGDAFDYLKNVDENTFDVILSDTTDPIGEAEKLFSEEFYRLMARALNEDGIVVTQCEQMYFDLDLIERMLKIAQGLRRESAYYHTLVPTYPGGGIGFLYLSDIPWTAGLGKSYPADLNYLNPDIHRAAFALPEFAAVRLAAL